MYDKSVQVTILIKITEQHEAESTFLKNKNFVFVTYPPTSELNTFDSDFNCTTGKSTLSHITVFLIQVMRFAKLNKHPPSKVLLKNKPPRGA